MAKKDIITEELPVLLTNKEKLEHGNALAKLSADAIRLQERKKEINTTLTAEGNRIASEISIHTQAINNGYEYRRVECKWEYDWERGIKTLIRQDTFESVRATAILPQEKQESLFEEEEEEKAKKQYELDRDKKLETEPEKPPEETETEKE